MGIFVPFAWAVTVFIIVVVKSLLRATEILATYIDKIAAQDYNDLT